MVFSLMEIFMLLITAFVDPDGPMQGAVVAGLAEDEKDTYTVHLSDVFVMYARTWTNPTNSKREGKRLEKSRSPLLRRYGSGFYKTSKRNFELNFDFFEFRISVWLLTIIEKIDNNCYWKKHSYSWHENFLRKKIWIDKLLFSYFINLNCSLNVIFLLYKNGDITLSICTIYQGWWFKLFDLMFIRIFHVLLESRFVFSWSCVEVVGYACSNWWCNKGRAYIFYFLRFFGFHLPTCGDIKQREEISHRGNKLFSNYSIFYKMLQLIISKK